MTHDTTESPSAASPFWRDPTGQRWLASAAIMAMGLIVGGFQLGDGLTRMKQAERSVTVRGVAERDVTADLAVWTLSYSSRAHDMASAQAQVDSNAGSIRAFFRGLGFPADALQPAGANVSQSTDNGITTYTVRQRLTLRTTDIPRAEAAVRKQFELVRAGVVLEEGSAMSYRFTGLNKIKPEMVAEATRDARKSAEQFANDSGSSVGTIRDATQGYFEISPRDGESDTWGVSDTPYKKVRVVTTVNYFLR